jgi:hypothetical protein
VPIAEMPGFTRGVDFAGNLAFVGLSQVRESAVFSGIPITERLTEHERTCGVCVIDLTSGQVVGLLPFETAVQEVFAVAVLPGRRFPELINDDEKLLENTFTVPDAALADVSPALIERNSFRFPPASQPSESLARTERRNGMNSVLPRDGAVSAGNGSVLRGASEGVSEVVRRQ